MTGNRIARRRLILRRERGGTILVDTLRPGREVFTDDANLEARLTQVLQGEIATEQPAPPRRPPGASGVEIVIEAAEGGFIVQDNADPHGRQVATTAAQVVRIIKELQS